MEVPLIAAGVGLLVYNLLSNRMRRWENERAEHGTATPDQRKVDAFNKWLRTQDVIFHPDSTDNYWDIHDAGETTDGNLRTDLSCRYGKCITGLVR